MNRHEFYAQLFALLLRAKQFNVPKEAVYAEMNEAMQKVYEGRGGFEV